MVVKATVPFPGHEPADEMDEALCRLRTLRLALLASSQKIADYNPGDAEMMIGEVLGQLEPIRNFLATLAQVIDQRPSGIEDDFKAWLAIRNEPTPDTDEAGDERYAQYRALQDKIIRAPAVSARDLAIMFYVDSDAGDSDNSDEFTDRVRTIAEGAANG